MGLMIIALFAPVSLEARSSSAIVIGNIEDQGYDPQDDGVIDFLKVSVNVNVEEEGTYTVYGLIETVNFELISSNNASFLQSGNGQLMVKFPGWQIYESKQNGPYTIHIRVTDSQQSVSATHITSSYSFEDFNPSVESPRLPIYNENLTLEFDSVMTKPSVTFYPTQYKENYNFRLSFDRILGFADDGDGVFTSQDTEVIRGDLSEKIWGWSLKQEGSSIRLNIHNTIKLWDVEGQMEMGTVDMSFIFNTNIQGTYKKFDIDMVFSQGLTGVDFISLEQHLVDESLKSDFEVTNLGGTTRIKFVDEQSEELAYYEWLEEAEFYGASAMENNSLSHNYEKSTREMTLYVHYPYTSDCQRIFHDPVVGLNSNVLQRRGPNIIEDVVNDHSLLVFGVAFVVGTVFVLLSLRYQRRHG